MLAHHTRRSKRHGFSYLELQVAFVLFTIAVSGLVPLSVMQSRQLSLVESRLDPDRTHYLTPSNREWARKLGASTSVTLAQLNLPSPPPDTPWTPVTVDDGDLGFSLVDLDTADWVTQSDSGAYQSDYYRNGVSGAPVGDKAIWTFTDLPPGTYIILETHLPIAGASPDAEYRIYEDTTLLSTKQIDQSVAPSQPDETGTLWNELATVDFYGTELRVELLDDPAHDDYIVADAIRVVPKGTDMQILNLTKSFNDDFVEARVQLPSTSRP